MHAPAPTEAGGAPQEVRVKEEVAHARMKEEVMKKVAQEGRLRDEALHIAAPLLGQVLLGQQHWEEAVGA